MIPTPKPELTEIERHLREMPGAFDFFQAVRLLQRLNPGKEPVGGFAPPETEAVRLSSSNALSFPPSPILSLDWSHEIPRMLVAFMGLTGHAGVLPYCYSELILDRQRAKDPTVPAFFDIFNHRMISLFYRAWEKYRFPVAYERSLLKGEPGDRVSKYLLSFIGLSTSGLQDRQAVEDHGLLYYTGLLSLQPRSASALEQILSDYFDVEVAVEQFVGAWHELSTPDQCIFEDADTFSEQLGVGAVVGDEIWDQQSRARIRIGPLSEDQYLDFLPSGTAFQPLHSLLKFFSNREFEFEVQLVLKRADVPAFELGREGPGGTMLGWFTWMKSVPEFGRNPDDTVLLLN